MSAQHHHDVLHVFDREGDSEVWVCSAIFDPMIVTREMNEVEHNPWTVADQAECPTAPKTHRHYHLVKKGNGQSRH